MAGCVYFLCRRGAISTTNFEKQDAKMKEAVLTISASDFIVYVQWFLGLFPFVIASLTINSSRQFYLDRLREETQSDLPHLRHLESARRRWPVATIIVPARNEELTLYKTLQSVLEIDNDLHLAQKVLKDPKATDAVKVITDKLSSFLKSKGFEEVQTDIYDEDLHEVISVVTTGQESIVDVVSKGWKLNGHVVKYPKVILSK